MIYYFIATIILIVIVIFVGQAIKKYTATQNSVIIVNWFIFLAILNIIIMMFIIASYKTLRFKPGPQGPPGLRGGSGSTGKDGSCTMCKPAITGLKPKRPYNIIDQIDPMSAEEEKNQLFVRPDERKEKLIKELMTSVNSIINNFVQLEINKQNLKVNSNINKRLIILKKKLNNKISTDLKQKEYKDINLIMGNINQVIHNKLINVIPQIISNLKKKFN
jgi:hypothetical protein